MEIQLIPYPFCGGEGEKYTYSILVSAFINCKECGAGTHIYKTIEEAIKA